MSHHAGFVNFVLCFWGKAAKWKGLASSGWMRLVLGCFRLLSSAVRQLWWSLERDRGCGREVEADGSGVVLLAGLNKPHGAAIRGEHSRGPPASRVPPHSTGDTARAQQYRRVWRS